VLVRHGDDLPLNGGGTQRGLLQREPFNELLQCSREPMRPGILAVRADEARESILPISGNPPLGRPQRDLRLRRHLGQRYSLLQMRSQQIEPVKGQGPLCFSQTG
jgi:hypothetical protein